MENIIVYLDDAAYAQQQLAPMQGDAAPENRGAATRWVLVACPPHMTRRIGKWVSHSARESWRAKWAEKLFDRIVPQLRSAGGEVITVVASGPLPELTRKLTLQHSAARVLDARRPKFGLQLQPVTASQSTGGQGAWEVPAAVAGMGAALILAAE
ncbi:MAG TPA: hypothetical protein VNS31_11610 [Ramlibacter sp.]|jgi:hypothetical protein|nr:hypothetical protein [Ramlibacter sp.]